MPLMTRGTVFSWYPLLLATVALAGLHTMLRVKCHSSCRHKSADTAAHIMSCSQPQLSSQQSLSESSQAKRLKVQNQVEIMGCPATAGSGTTAPQNNILEQYLLTGAHQQHHVRMPPEHACQIVNKIAVHNTERTHLQLSLSVSP